MEVGMTGSEPDETLTADDVPSSPGLGRFAAGLLCGLALGAGLALLFAPHAGDRTRRRLRRRLERIREGTADSVTRADALRRELQRRREAR
jgi:gas vesicle protein